MQKRIFHVQLVKFEVISFSSNAELTRNCQNVARWKNSIACKSEHEDELMHNKVKMSNGIESFNHLTPSIRQEYNQPKTSSKWNKNAFYLTTKSH